MKIFIIALHIFSTIFNCVAINRIDVPNGYAEKARTRYEFVETSESKDILRLRRYWLVTKGLNSHELRAGSQGDEKDANLKIKISTLVLQTVHDTERKIKSIQHMKEKHRERAPYRAGFILSMVKKTRDVLNELFNVAVKHRDEWKALEQLKIFELIVHTNVDTTNLVRQLVEVHIQSLNTTHTDSRRVVLM